MDLDLGIHQWDLYKKNFRMGFPLQEGEVLALADSQSFVFLSPLFGSSLMKLTHTC